MLRIFISILLIGEAFAVILEDGPCPSLYSKVAVDLNKVAGVWYEYKHSKSIEVKENRCSRLIWGVPVDNVSRVLFTTFSIRDNINSTTVSDICVENNKIILDVQLPILGSLKGDYYFLETDYDNYLIIVGCQELDCQHSFLAWIKTRNPNPPKEIDEIIESAFEKRHLEVPDLVLYDTHNCYEEDQEETQSSQSSASSEASASSSSISETSAS